MNLENISEKLGGKEKDKSDSSYVLEWKGLAALIYRLHLERIGEGN